MMSGQLDTAWGGVPTSMDMIRAGQGRIIGTGDDSMTLRTGSHRVIVANANWLAKNREAAVRAMRALWKGQQFNFSGDAATKRYADHWKFDYDDAKTVHQFYKLTDLTLAPVSNLEASLKLAEEYGFLKEPLTDAQKKGLIDIVYDPDRK
jgi:ABC-type nitrate/sulfonate/bicarbonate transport system substrate-binding protein